MPMISFRVTLPSAMQAAISAVTRSFLLVPGSMLRRSALKRPNMASVSDFVAADAGRTLIRAADAFSGAAEGLLLMMLSFVVPVDTGDSYVFRRQRAEKKGRSPIPAHAPADRPAHGRGSSQSCICFAPASTAAISVSLARWL